MGFKATTGAARSAGRNAAPAPTAIAPKIQSVERALGNRNTGLMHNSLRISQPGDAGELEADRVARRVMAQTFDGAVAHRPAPVPAQVQRKCQSCEEELPVQRKASGQGAAPAAAGNSAAVITAGGQPLAAPARSFFEPRFGHSFEQVRVHDDAAADRSARALGAKAYTVGRHISFARGQYNPGSHAGRELLAHELTHTIQQGDSAAAIQRVCDPALLAARTVPLYFPRHSVLMEVYRGALTLGLFTTPRVSVGLVQQALVDLGYVIGTGGPNADGVDRIHSADTAAAITAFQTAEGITGATAGVIDQATLKCLDEKRSRLVMPAHLTGSVSPQQVWIQSPATGGRDEDIFFDRGSYTLNADARAKIGRLITRTANPLQGCRLTLEGFASEDEAIEYPNLAASRINVVDREFASQGHDSPGPSCPSPAPPLRTPSPLPAASSGVSDYRHRRKVEVVPAGASSTTAPCPAGAAQFRPLTGTEGTILTAAIDLAVGWMNAALGELTPGDPEGDAALNAYFGGTGLRSTIRTNLTTWRDHLDTVVRTNNQHGTQCNAPCRTAIAFNQDSGPAAQMTVCPRFFGSLSVHPTLTQAEQEAFVMLHEAGHGSIRANDIGYGHRRLIEFLAGFPTIAEDNTDSYTLMVLCLNGFTGFCAAPVTTDTPVGMNATEQRNSRRGLAWLHTWLMWAEQDTSSLYGQMNMARESGQGIRAVNFFYAGVYDELVSAFGLHRPPGDPPPTFGEQMQVAAILDRIEPMESTARAGLRVEKVAAGVPGDRWGFGLARSVFLTSRYFSLTTDRARVEFLLPLMLKANARISRVLEPKYETFIKKNVINNRDDRP
jgi:hypothetical protein